MSFTTLPYPSTPDKWESVLTLRNTRRNDALILTVEVWMCCLRAALYGDWRPAGTIVSRDEDVRDGYRVLNAVIEGGDAKALGKSLERALDKLRKMNRSERLAACYHAEHVPSTKPNYGERKYLFAFSGLMAEQVGAMVAAFHILEQHIPHEGGTDAAPIVIALRQLAEWLKAGDDVRIQDDRPATWLPPGTSKRTVRIRTGQGRSFQVGGHVVSGGETITLAKDVAEDAVAGEYADALDAKGAVIVMGSREPFPGWV